MTELLNAAINEATSVWEAVFAPIGEASFFWVMWAIFVVVYLAVKLAAKEALSQHRWETLMASRDEDS